MNETGTLAQSHNGTQWRVSGDGMMARPADDPNAEWRDINEVRMENGVLWPVQRETSDG